ncbi:MAG: CAP domain-containing protein [Anaerolineae bacterium]|nr:CAP domain-containing protein [Anaerolineae bacterium]
MKLRFTMGQVKWATVVLLLILLWCGGGVAGAQPPSRVTGPVTGSWDIQGHSGFQRSLAYGPAAIQDTEDWTRLEYEVVVLTNQARMQAGLPPLKLNEALRQAARAHARDMAENNFFGHVGSDGSTLVDRINRVNYPNWLYAAENIAAGFAKPADVVNAWLASPHHRANLLHPNLKEIGVGYVYDPNDQANVRLPDGTIGGPYYHYWVQDFGTRMNTFPVIINLDAYSTMTRRVNLYIYGEGWAQQMKVSNYLDFHDAKWQPFRSTMTWTLLPGRGTRTVYVRLKSSIGLTVESSDSIELLPPDPSTYGLELNDGAQFTNQRDLHIKIHAPDGTTKMRLSFSSNLSSVPWQAYTAETVLQVPEGVEGNVTVYGQIKIGEDWQSPIFHNSIIVDLSPPSGAVVIQEVRPTQLKLLIAAEDSVSGVAEMQVGYDPQLRDATWVPYTPVVTLSAAESLGSSASTTVYARLRDHASNESPILSSLKLNRRVFIPAIVR